VVAYAGVPGAYATTRLLPARRAIKLSPAIAPELAAATLLRGLTVHMLLTRTFPVRGGETLLVHAAAGGLGGSVTRWAKRLGCTVIGTVGSEQKAAIARAAGADHVIVGRDADFVGEVAAITDGAGVDFAVDGIGGAVLSKTLACVRRFGTVASMGQTAGAIPPLALDELGPARSLSLARPSVMAYSAEPETYTAACEAVLSALSEGVLPGTFSRYKLEDVAQAHRDLELGATTGSLILVP
jgi:NADPH2:quinone reductase